MYAQWQEVFDIGRLTFMHPEEYVRLETECGERLSIYTNLDRLDTELLTKAPQDDVEIRRFTAAARRLAKLELPDPTEGWPRSWLTFLRTLPYLPLLRQWSSLSSDEYGKRFTHPLLRSFFGGGELAQLSALALVLPLAWMSQRNAGYPIGGSQAVIRLIVERLLGLGGHLRLGTTVERILVERDAAVGVQLAGGETMAADWVISAADGHATIYDLLGGRYTDKVTDEIYRTWKTFPSYLQLSLGVARDLSEQAGYVTRLLDAPLMVDPSTHLQHISFRFFHFDPTFATPGKTAVTCVLPTYNVDFWVDLQQGDPAQYQAEKHRVAEAVIALLERSVADVRRAIEGDRRVDPGHRHPLHGQLEGQYGGLALDAQHGPQTLTEHLAGFAAVLDGGPMGHAGRRAAVGPDDGTIRSSSSVQARSGTVRGLTGCCDRLLGRNGAGKTTINQMIEIQLFCSSSPGNLSARAFSFPRAQSIPKPPALDPRKIASLSALPFPQVLKRVKRGTMKSSSKSAPRRSKSETETDAIPRRSWSAATIQFLTQSETRALLAAIDSKRDTALFLIAYRHGLRASEVGLLRVEDLDLQQYRLRIQLLKHSLSGLHPLLTSRRQDEEAMKFLFGH